MMLGAKRLIITIICYSHINRLSIICDMVLHGFFTVGMCICIGYAVISHDNLNNSKYFCKETIKPRLL